MITVFNRRELITIPSQQKYFRIRRALSAAGIANATKIRGIVRAAARARYGVAGLQQDALYSYTIYVHRDDYDRAAAAIQSALQET